LSFAVHKVCQDLSHPTSAHYVKGIVSTDFRLQNTPSYALNIFTDADWAGYLDDRRSTD
jgi:hypothetical protein